jgi:FkbM family methyltransferase
LTTLTAHGATVRFDDVDRRDHIGRVIAVERAWYERKLLDDARRRVPTGLAVDVGAHIGNHTLWFSQVCALPVVALEPNPDSYRRLLRNIAANSANVTPFNVAAGRLAGTGTLVAPRPGNSGTAAVDPGDGDVTIVALDDLDLASVALLKIDVEGSAVDVLAGAERILTDDRPVIYAEGERDDIAAALPDGYRCFGQFAHTPTWGFAT